ncbi:MAG: hypothetical protein ACRCXT_18000 [Paraclostridium sp.]
MSLVYYKDKELHTDIDMFVSFFNKSLDNISEYIYDKYKQITFNDLVKFEELCSKYGISIRHGKWLLHIFMVRNNGYNRISTWYINKYYGEYIEDGSIRLSDLITKNR